MKFIELTPQDFTRFAAKSPYKSFMQTEQIATLRARDGWTVYYLGVKDGDQIKAATMLVAKPTFLGKSTFIAPGGPLLDLEDTALTDLFFKNLKNYIKTHNGYTFQISPYYELIERDRDGAPLPDGFNHQNAIKNLTNLSFLPVKNPSQPKYMFAMDIDGRSPEELMADFKRNTRNHIRKAEKSGVVIRELSREELPLFKQITESTSERRHFTDRPLAYYEQMYDLFHDKGEVKFLIAEVNKGTQSDVSVLQHCAGADSHNDQHLRNEYAASGRGAVSPKCCNYDVREPSTLQNTSSDCSSTSLSLSAAMFMLYGDEVVYLFSGSDEKYMKEYNAQYLIQWHMLRYAAEHNFKRYNFYGISGLPKNGELDGIYDFKKGFDTKHGHVLEYVGSYETSTNPVFYHLHKLLSSIKHH